MARSYGLMSIVFRDLFSLKLIHILTISTMAIGSLAMASTFFIGDGALEGLWADLDRLMGNHIIVYPDAGPDGTLLKRRRDDNLTTEDLQRVQLSLEDAKYVAPRFFIMTDIDYGGIRRRMPVDGITRELFSEPSYRPLYGRTFSSDAAEGLVCECLLDESAMKMLAVDLSKYPIIQIANRHCLVVGVSADPPEADTQFRARIIVPYALAQFIWGTPGTVNTIVVGWRSPEEMEKIVSKLRNVLDEARAPGAYYLSSSQFTITKRKNIVANFMVFGMVQSFFCILVASIGVVNVMLSNVVRRSREFAIRVAMGARPSHLGVIVITESLGIALMGATIGVLAALSVSPYLCSIVSTKIVEANALTPRFGFRGVLIPIAVCALSGLIAGIVPALRAKRLDILPILRQE